MKQVRTKNTDTVYYGIYNLQYMEFRKMVMTTIYVRQQKRHNIKNRLLDSVGEGEGGMI